MLAIGDGLVLTDKNGHITLINDTFSKMLGWTREECLNQKLINIVPMLDKNQRVVLGHHRLINRAMLRKETVTSDPSEEIYYKRKDETFFPVYIIVSPILYKGESIGAVQVFRDISKEKDIEKSKTEFFSLASHQLRTPVSVINWYLELLQHSKPENLTHLQNKYLLEIYNASQHMTDLLNTLLNLSRLDLGTFKLDMQIISPEKFLDEILKELEMMIKNKNLTVKIDIDKEAKVKSDLNLFKVILQNLISNAVKYTKENGEVDIKIGNENGAFVIKISDNGYGIPDDQKPFIFTKMFRAKNIKDKVPDGTGIGLYLVKKVVETLKGEISFESKINEGTTFRVSLPNS